MKVLSYCLLSICLLATACSQSEQDFVSPADHESLSRLEEKTLEMQLSKNHRAKLFFLWGQELAQQNSDPEALAKAISAFEKVVDLAEILQDESRYNLEILYQRQKEQEEQKEQQEQQEEQDNQQEENKEGQDDQSKDQSDAKDSKQEQSEQGEQGQAPENQPRDMSSLVREKPSQSELEEALEAEQERRQVQEQNKSGGVVPVDKDW